MTAARLPRCEHPACTCIHACTLTLSFTVPFIPTDRSFARLSLPDKPLHVHVSYMRCTLDASRLHRALGDIHLLVACMHPLP